MKSIPKLKKKKSRNLPEESLAAALNYDKLMLTDKAVFEGQPEYVSDESIEDLMEKLK